LKWKSYWLIARNTFNENFIYTRDTVSGAIFSIVVLVIQITVWTALYASVDNLPIAGRTIDDMITYVIVVSLVGLFTSEGRIARLLEERMKSGEIALDAMRPTSPRLMLAARTWGDKMMQFLGGGIAVIACIIWVGGITTPDSIVLWLIFISALLLGYIINLMFAYVTACFAFYFISVNTLNWFISFFVLSMSGAFVPLWLLPEWLRNIALALPFQATIFIPMNIYMGTMEYSGLLNLLLIQLAWILGLGILQQILWKSGMRRIVIHGG